MQVMCMFCKRTFDLKQGSKCEYCGEDNKIYGGNR